MIKKAMILAAGLGSRLGEITRNQPKALVKIDGVAMIDGLLFKLQNTGIEEVMINLHHHADKIIAHIAANQKLRMQIYFSDESDILLDTGGALVAAKAFFTGDSPILIHNVDILTNFDIKALERFHQQKKADATLFVSNRQSSRALLFDIRNYLTGWANFKTSEFKWVDKPTADYLSFSFNGVWLTNPELIDRIKFTGKFSIIDAWLQLASEQRLVGYVNDKARWHDLGTPEKIRNAEDELNLKTP